MWIRFQGTFFVLFCLFSAPNTHAHTSTQEELSHLKSEALLKSKSYWPKYIDEAQKMCAVKSKNEPLFLEQCLLSLVEKSKTVLSCEFKHEFWTEMVMMDQQEKKQRQTDFPGSSSPPSYIKAIFAEVTQAGEHFALSYRSRPEFVSFSQFHKNIKWNLEAFNPKTPNATAGAGGDVLISENLWAADSIFTPDDIRAILAHEIAHVLLNHSLQMGCLALEWNQGVGTLKDSRDIFSEDPYGAFPLGRSRQMLSQKNEALADEYAVYILQKMGRSKLDMKNVLIKLKNSQVSSFSSGSHPEFEERILNIERIEFFF